MPEIDRLVVEYECHKSQFDTCKHVVVHVFKNGTNERKYLNRAHIRAHAIDGRVDMDFEISKSHFGI